MGAIADREQLIRNILRLRRAERATSAGEDIAAVRADLERAVGSTVSRALSARLLGVSQTALDRRIGQGEVPVVMTPRGRREIPLSALVGLVEAVEAQRHAAREARPVAAVMRNRRADAARLDPHTAVPGTGSRSGHGSAEARSLAYHRAVAQRLDRATVEEARHRLRRWHREGRIDPRYAEPWERLLGGPLSTVRDVIGQDSQESRDLRQNSPFAGTLTTQERRRVLDAVG
jgi:hypothetical protein